MMWQSCKINCNIFGKRSIKYFICDLSLHMSPFKKHCYPIFKHIVSYSYGLHVEPDNKIVCECVTDSFTRITGYTISELNACGGWLSLIYIDDMPSFMKHLDCLISGQSDVTEFRIITKSKEIRWLCDYAQPVWGDRENRVIRIYGTAQDITKYKKLLSNGVLE